MVPTYRLHDTTGDDLGLSEHPAPNVEPGDVVVLEDRREALVTAGVEAQPGPVTALLEGAIAPTPLTSDESIAWPKTRELPEDRGAGAAGGCAELALYGDLERRARGVCA
jgi:hypothetical protein